MAWRFRKSIKIIPGVRLNFSSRGMSTTIGVRGVGMNFSDRGVYGFVSIPGTGISYRERLDSSKQPTFNNLPLVHTDILSDNIVSADICNITSQDMQGVKDLILLTHEQRQSITNSMQKVKFASILTRAKLIGSYITLIGVINKTLSNNLKLDLESQKEIIKDLKLGQENSFVNLEIIFDELLQTKYDRLQNSFKSLIGTRKVWDLTSSYYNDRVKTRSAASSIVARKITEIQFKNLPDIKLNYEPFYLKNINGADLYFYPNFLIIYDSKNKFAIVGYNELDFEFSQARFVETESVPSDTKVLEYTWDKVNKNGKRDKRFKSNFQIPIVQYGKIELKSPTGLHEVYQFSNYEMAYEFSSAFIDYQKAITKMNTLN